MNAAQRRILVRGLFATFFVVLLAIPMESGGGETWWLVVPPVAIVSALYLRAGGKKE